MSDLLVKLYDLPESAELLAALREEGYEIKRAIAPEKELVTDWVREKFSRNWSSEADAAFAHTPPGIFIAVKEGKVAGFACYDATAKGFFGPMGVDEELRGTGLGKALLVRTLEAMREAGYGYAVIGWAGPVEFFRKTVGAEVIPGSEPGIYKNFVQ